MNHTTKTTLAAIAAICTLAPVGALASASASPGVSPSPVTARAEAAASTTPARGGQPEVAVQASADQVTRELASFDAANPRLAVAQAGVDIPVYVKVFYDRQTGAGKLTYSQALDQVKWLNHSYSGGQGGVGTRFDFVFKGYKNIPVDSRRVNLSGNSNGNGSTYNSRVRSLMRNHHDGGAKTLNLYVADIYQTGVSGLLGKSTFPQYAKANTSYDGVWVDKAAWRSTPNEGGAFSAQGDTAVHEVGHWIGALAHTDTSGACRANFMSYASDACMTSFTSGQADRMSSAWTRYRD